MYKSIMLDFDDLNCSVGWSSCASKISLFSIYIFFIFILRRKKKLFDEYFIWCKNAVREWGLKQFLKALQNMCSSLPLNEFVAIAIFISNNIILSYMSILAVPSCSRRSTIYWNYLVTSSSSYLHKYHIHKPVRNRFKI